jgi:hypothetical protein
MAGGVASHGAFQGESPLDYALPLVILQICLVIVVTRGLAYLLRPLRQPRVIAEIIVSNQPRIYHARAWCRYVDLYVVFCLYVYICDVTLLRIHDQNVVYAKQNLFAQSHTKINKSHTYSTTHHVVIKFGC